LKRVYLNILPNSAFGCPTHDVHGFSYQSSPTSDKARLEQLESENRQLGKQLRQAELEREILKKATAYFAKESQ
jgi:transposase-like protein